MQGKASIVLPSGKPSPHLYVLLARLCITVGLPSRQSGHTHTVACITKAFASGIRFIQEADTKSLGNSIRCQL